MTHNEPNDPESNLHEIWYPTQLRDADFKSEVYFSNFANSIPLFGILKF